MTARPFAEVIGPGSEQEPVLLLHSLGLDHTMWHPCAPFLAADRRLLLADLPGHGRSPAGAELAALLDDAGAATSARPGSFGSRPDHGRARFWPVPR
ncbi:hypothetical protein GCM10023195_75430 [Actinoallomurus liliacearum]|uniref:AB hydrolase-1 domain-containing protein n=1 Tax=Actinoallomurus liliacearum TaxID=1080073 RepID=A0ABP8TX64_9ACTN